MMSYKKLEVWQLAREVSIEVHEMTLHQLPSFEKFETGSQIRRSAKSVRSNIVEGFGRRVYKQEFLRFLIYSVASNHETLDHLETLYECKSLTDETLFNSLHEKINLLGKKLNNFIQSVGEKHNMEPDNN